MKKLLLFLCVLPFLVKGQTVVTLSTADTSKIRRTTGTTNAELKIFNADRNVTNGIGYNAGSGWLRYATVGNGLTFGSNTFRVDSSVFANKTWVNGRLLSFAPASGSSTYVPYTGATTWVNLGSRPLSSGPFIAESSGAGAYSIKAIHTEPGGDGIAMQAINASDVTNTVVAIRLSVRSDSSTTASIHHVKVNDNGTSGLTGNTRLSFDNYQNGARYEQMRMDRLGIALYSPLLMATNNIDITGSIGSTGSRAAKLWATNIESTNMPTVGGTSLSSTFAPIASPTFTGTVTIPSPFTLGSTSVTTTGTKLNFLTSAAGTTGTTSTNLVFSTSPTLVTPVLGVASATSLALSGALSGATTIGASSVISSAGGVKVTGLIAPVGLGAEVVYTGGVGIFQTYNRTGSVYLPTALDGSTVKLQISGVEALGIDASKNSIFAGTLGINGTADNVKGGTYTPTLTNGGNVSASTAYACTYTRLGDIVYVDGKADLTMLAGSVVTVGVSLPIASNISAANDANGVISQDTGNSSGLRIIGDAANDRVTITGGESGGSATIAIHFSYKVL